MNLFVKALHLLVQSSYQRLCSLAGHPWVQVGGAAPDKPLDSAVLSRLKKFSAMNKFKKMALRVSTCNPEELIVLWNISLDVYSAGIIPF